jgi:UDP-N-acetylmuramoyl-tripeptide--D-alanyl-D-alanine ligase
LHEQGASFDLYINNAFKITVHTMLSGRFNIYNILAAISVGHLFNIEAMNIKQAVDEFHGVPMRLEMKERNGIRFIYDVYNANPASMEQGIQELVRRKKTGRAIAVLGDMLELGRYAEDAHRDLGRRISDLPVDVLISVGPLMSVTADAFLRESIRAADSVEAGKILLQLCRAGDIVLIKGSRGMRMERVLES